MRYLNIFIEMAVIEFLFLLKLEKKSKFWVRLVVTAVVFSVASYFAGCIGGLGKWAWVRSLVPMALGIAFVVLCYRMPVIKAVCFGIISYSIQNTAYIFHLFIMTAFPFMPSLVNVIIDYVLFAGVLCVYWFMFGRSIRMETLMDVKSLKSLLVCVLVLIASYALIIFERELPEIAIAIAGVSTIICNFLSMALLFGFTREDALAREKAEIERLLQMEETIHRISKESIDLINFKSHDLKHRLDLLCAGGKFPEEDVNEIRELVGVYDGFVKTGNDDLDIVIAEKYLRCRKSGIILACIADGKRLGFMSAGDIYSLFGNAIENAIEYLESIGDRSKRIINLKIQASGEFVSVKIDNYCESHLKFEDGLPVTNKTDGRFHGFGMKSMNYIAKKYNGTLCCELKDKLFSVYMIFSM